MARADLNPFLHLITGLKLGKNTCLVSVPYNQIKVFCKELSLYFNIYNDKGCLKLQRRDLNTLTALVKINKYNGFNYNKIITSSRYVSNVMYHYTARGNLVKHVVIFDTISNSY